MQPPIAYPEQAREFEVEGTARFEARVASDGTVTEVRVVEVPSNREDLKQAIELAVSQWTFLPAMEEGSPVQGVYRGAIEFRVPSVPGARSYSVSPEQVWEAVLAVAKAWGLKRQTRIPREGILITRYAMAGSGDFQLHSDMLGGKYPIRGIQFHIFVPQHLKRSRVYVHSKAEAGYGLEDYVFFNQQQFADEFFVRLDRVLQQQGEPVPGSAARRAALERLEYETSEDCRDQSLKLQPPELITQTKIIPPYPFDNKSKGMQSIIVEGQIQRDGTAEGISVRSAEGERSLQVSVLETIKLWRYRPARQGNCPVAVRWTVKVNYVP